MINGRKWFITGAGDAVALSSWWREHPTTSAEALTAFLYHKDQPGWRIVRRIAIMGPEEHGGHCELEFDGLEVADEDVLMTAGDGLKQSTQIRLGPARLHALHALARPGPSAAWRSRRPMSPTATGFGIRLADRESVQMKLGEVAHQIADRPAADDACGLEARSGRSRPQGSLDGQAACAPIPCTTRRRRGDPAQRRARLFKDTILGMGVSRCARGAARRRRLREVHKMVLARFMREEGRDFWSWSAEQSRVKTAFTTSATLTQFLS